MVNRIRSAFQIFMILTIPITVQWPAVRAIQAVFCYWSTSAVFSILQSSILALPSVVDRINPGLTEDLKQVYSNSLMPEECKRLANIIVTGEEGYTATTEEDVEKEVTSYITQQNKMARRK